MLALSGREKKDLKTLEDVNCVVYLHTTLSGMHERDTTRAKEFDIVLKMAIEHILTQSKTLDKELLITFY